MDEQGAQPGLGQVGPEPLVAGRVDRGGAQPRALDTNTCSDSQPTARALPTAWWRPPATETWAPTRTSEQVGQEADVAAALGLLAAAGALLDDPVADREHEAGVEAGGP